MSKILITYYTKTNTTKEICEYIGNKLGENGDGITIKPISEANDIISYDKVIIGAPINAMMWVKEAKGFVLNNADILKTKKVGLFFNAYLIDNCYGFWNSRIKNSLKLLKKCVAPIVIGKFGGRVDKPFKGFPKLLFGSKSNSPLDRRNWDEIVHMKMVR